MVTTPKRRGGQSALGGCRDAACLTLRPCLVLGLVLGLVFGAGSAIAAPSPSRPGASPKAAAARASVPPNTKASTPRRARKRAAAKVGPAAPARAEVKLEAEPAARYGAAEARVDAAEPAPNAGVVRTVEAAAGVKTYTFDAQEVEGRLRSPQILYFLRRVRAEFDPQPLGHRSFLLELSDTRRQPALQ